jgi:hypothetical protein
VRWQQVKVRILWDGRGRDKWVLTISREGSEAHNADQQPYRTILVSFAADSTSAQLRLPLLH